LLKGFFTSIINIREEKGAANMSVYGEKRKGLRADNSAIKQALNKYREQFAREENARRRELKGELNDK